MVGNERARMSERIKQWGPVVAMTVGAIGIVANFILLLVYFVNDHQLLQQHQGILNAYESHGTPSVVAMKSTYDERFRATEARIEKMENAVAGISDMKLDLRSINVTLGVLSKTLDSHMAATKSP